jgi:hypothetical protein
MTSVSTSAYRIDMVRALRKLRAAYEAGQLSAQNNGACRYVDPQCGPCAIGAMLPKAVLSRIVAMGLNEDTNVFGLLDAVGKRGSPLFDEYSFRDRSWLNDIQDAHDKWIYAHTDYDTPHKAEAEFVRVLELAEAKYGVRRAA